MQGHKRPLTFQDRVKRVDLSDIKFLLCYECGEGFASRERYNEHVIEHQLVSVCYQLYDFETNKDVIEPPVDLFSLAKEQKLIPRGKDGLAKGSGIRKEKAKDKEYVAYTGDETGRRHTIAEIGRKRSRTTNLPKRKMTDPLPESLICISKKKPAYTGRRSKFPPAVRSNKRTEPKFATKIDRPFEPMIPSDGCGKVKFAKEVSQLNEPGVSTATSETSLSLTTRVEQNEGSCKDVTIARPSSKSLFDGNNDLTIPSTIPPNPTEEMNSAINSILLTEISSTSDSVMHDESPRNIAYASPLLPNCDVLTDNKGVKDEVCSKKDMEMSVMEKNQISSDLSSNMEKSDKTAEGSDKITSIQPHRSSGSPAASICASTSFGQETSLAQENALTCSNAPESNDNNLQRSCPSKEKPKLHQALVNSHSLTSSNAGDNGSSSEEKKNRASENVVPRKGVKCSECSVSCSQGTEMVEHAVRCHRATITKLEKWDFKDDLWISEPEVLPTEECKYCERSFKSPTDYFLHLIICHRTNLLSAGTNRYKIVVHLDAVKMSTVNIMMKRPGVK